MSSQSIKKIYTILERGESTHVAGIIWDIGGEEGVLLASLGPDASTSRARYTHTYWTKTVIVDYEILWKGGQDIFGGWFKSVWDNSWNVFFVSFWVQRPRPWALSPVWSAKPATELRRTSIDEAWAPAYLLTNNLKVVRTKPPVCLGSLFTSWLGCLSERLLFTRLLASFTKFYQVFPLTL